MGKKISTLFLFFLIISCSPSKEREGGGVSVNVNVTANPSTISPGGSSTITVSVTDQNNNPSQVGETVSFTADPSSAGNFSPSSTTIADDGSATTVFTASTYTGTVRIMATIGPYSGSTTINIQVGGAYPSSVTVVASPGEITPGGTSTITAFVRTSSGTSVGVGVSVTFQVVPSGLGTIVPTNATTDQDGNAIATFTAGSQEGIASIYAYSGSASGYANLTIRAPDLSSIIFVSAEPPVIDLFGTGGQSTSLITFKVVDTNGNPVPNVPVDFTLYGPSPPGMTGTVEYIYPQSTTTNEKGEAYTVLTSGSIAGTARIEATATNPRTGRQIKSSSSPISIGGGKPSHLHFQIVREKANISGFIWSGLHDKITAFVADRFSNIVRTPVNISFFTEAGGIQTSATTDPNYGQATVILQSQAPYPRDITTYPPQTEYYFMPASFTTCSQAYTYGTRYMRFHNPGDGEVTILAITKGEETFIDENANGIYDPGEMWYDISEPFIDSNGNGIWDPAEPFTDLNSNGIYDPPEPFSDENGNCTYDPGEPFSDYNGNGLYDYGEPFTDVNKNNKWDPEEFYFDGNNNGKFDGPNGRWDSDINIWTSTSILFTGEASVRYYYYECDLDCSTNCNRINAPYISNDSKCLEMDIYLADINWNPPPVISRILIKDKDKNITYLEVSNPYSPSSFYHSLIYPLYLRDPFPSNLTPATSTISVEIEWIEGDMDKVSVKDGVKDEIQAVVY